MATLILMFCVSQASIEFYPHSIEEDRGLAACIDVILLLDPLNEESIKCLCLDIDMSSSNVTPQLLYRHPHTIFPRHRPVLTHREFCVAKNQSPVEVMS